MNDSATGANLDSMQEYYGVDYDQISIVFLANTAGYFISSMSSSFMLHHFGLQASLLVACAGMSIGCVVLSVAPPFAAFIVMLMFMGFGSGVSCARIVRRPLLAPRALWPDSSASPPPAQMYDAVRYSRSLYTCPYLASPWTDARPSSASRSSSPTKRTASS